MKSINTILQELKDSIQQNDAKQYDDRMNDLVDSVILRKERLEHKSYIKIVEKIREKLSSDMVFQKQNVLNKFNEMIPEHEKDLGISLKEMIKKEIKRLLK